MESEKSTEYEKGMEENFPVQANNEKEIGFLLFAFAHDKTEKILEIYEPQTKTMMKVPTCKVQLLIDSLQDYIPATAAKG